MSENYSLPVKGASVACKIIHDGNPLNFSTTEATKSSTWRELYAVYYSILSLAPFLATRHVEWQTDNFAASLIVTKGSTKLELQYFSENTFEICNRYRISFSIKWIPRALLADVDTMSRKIDFDDWD